MKTDVCRCVGDSREALTLLATIRQEYNHGSQTKDSREDFEMRRSGLVLLLCVVSFGIAHAITSLNIDVITNPSSQDQPFTVI